MVKKFSVGIPDELAARLEPFKGKYSPTAVFQKAMESQAEKLEQWKANTPKGEKMDAIVERLRKQKEESEGNDYELGRKEGVDFAKSADYDSLKAAVKLAEEAWSFRNEYHYIQGDMLFRNDDLEDYFRDSDLCGYKIETSNNNVESLTDASEKWFDGWMDGVYDFWNKLPDDLKS